jgi:hypothetical protein
MMKIISLKTNQLQVLGETFLGRVGHMVVSSLHKKPIAEIPKTLTLRCCFDIINQPINGVISITVHLFHSFFVVAL